MQFIFEIQARPVLRLDTYVSSDMLIFCGLWPKGIGPGIPFARSLTSEGPDHALQAESNALVGLIPTAVGGTAIEHWCPGGLLFNMMIEQVSIGMRKADQSGHRPRLSGLLFYQGESDAASEELAVAYESRLEVFT